MLAEVLLQAPSWWYLTGFLVPTDADPDHETDDTADEGSEELETGAGADDEATPEPAAARKAFFPSPMGLNLLVPKGTKELHATVRWGDYLPDGATDITQVAAPEALGRGPRPARSATSRSESGGGPSGSRNSPSISRPPRGPGSRPSRATPGSPS